MPKNGHKFFLCHREVAPVALRLASGQVATPFTGEPCTQVPSSNLERVPPLPALPWAQLPCDYAWATLLGDERPWTHCCPRWRPDPDA